MGFELAKGAIDDMRDCMGKGMLAYVTYPQSGARCFTYPQYMLDGGRLTRVSAKAFPDVGCLPASISSGEMPSVLAGRYGSIAIVTLNQEPQQNKFYDADFGGSEPNQYNGAINTMLPKGRSVVELTAFGRHALSSMLMQVIEVQESVDLKRPLGQPVHLFSEDEQPLTKFVLIEQSSGATSGVGASGVGTSGVGTSGGGTSGGASGATSGRRKLVGPFEARATSPDEVMLSAASDGTYDFCVAALNADGFSTYIELKDGKGDTAARFVAADEFMGKFASCSDSYDWIGDDTLREALGRIARIGGDPFTKAQVASLKYQITTCGELEARVSLTPARRKRMLDLVSVQGEWAALSDDIRDGALERADPEQLAEYVLSDDHFRSFYDKVIENDHIGARVEKEKARYEEAVRKIKRQIEEGERDLAGVRAEIRAFEGSLEEKKRQLEEEMAQRLADLREQESALKGEVAGLEQEKARLEEAEALVRSQVRKTVEGMSDELALSSKVLESEMVRQIVSSLGAQAGRGAGGDAGAGGPEAPGVTGTLGTPGATGTPGAPETSEPSERPAAPTPPAPVRAGEVSAREVVDEVGSHINEAGGRDMDGNEVANLLICLAQGYIVTLAGLPGTGKTSLANLLAGALGLKGGGSPGGLPGGFPGGSPGLGGGVSRRFVEVPVERGWTSYKDFVGYYNPFTQTLEKANAAVFEAFEQLDAEVAAGWGAGDVPPFLFLLDEANLSSIEHYWSPFLRVCDSFREGPSELSLGGDKVLRVPGYVRFLATVNFDHTTEELSPRFLDRSWVITLEPDDLDIEDMGTSAAGEVASAGPAFSHAALQRLFGPQKDAMLGNDLRTKLKEVLDACSACHQPVSPRSRQMMVAYACTASGIMDRSSAASAYAPVDYAVCQKVLPRLSGTEERLAELLGRLAGIGGLPLTKARVEHMLEVGGDSGYFQYFA